MLDASEMQLATVDSVKVIYLGLNLVILVMMHYNFIRKIHLKWKVNLSLVICVVHIPKEELQTIESFANDLGMELVPCIQTLAFKCQLTRYRQYGHLFDTLDIFISW